MKSYLFTTETDRGGVMLCDIDEFDEAVEYLCERFDGVVKVESGEQVWQLDSDQSQIAQVDTAPSAEQSTAENDLFG